MKLLKKTSNAYLLISAMAFLIAGVIIYLTLSYTLDSQINERLGDSQIEIIKKLEKRESILNDPPFREIEEVNVIPVRSKFSSDTMIFDPDEKEAIPYRQAVTYNSVNGKIYHIVIRNALIEKGDILLTIILTSLSVFILLLIALFILNRKLSLRIWNPFYKILNDLKGFSQNNLLFALSYPGEIDEFKELHDTLDKLTRKVVSDYHSLKRFTEDASHEIQTPVAIIQTKLETLIQSPDLGKEQTDLISAISIANSRLSRLTRGLLLLTKIENRQFSDFEECDLTAIIRNQINSMIDSIKEKSLTIEEHLEVNVNLKANSFLTESMVMNLLGNAIRHNKIDGVIIIELDQSSLIIRNTGYPLAVSPDKLFDRFYKANPGSESLGLGLSIVKKICEVNGWQIVYSFDNDFHVVRVTFQHQ